jgi:hypothetical protein
MRGRGLAQQEFILLFRPGDVVGNKVMMATPDMPTTICRNSEPELIVSTNWVTKESNSPIQKTAIDRPI